MTNTKKKKTTKVSVRPKTSKVTRSPPKIKKCERCHATKLWAAFKNGSDVCDHCVAETTVNQQFDNVFHEPRIAFVDVECAPSIGAYWGKPWQTNILQETENWYLLSYAVKWSGSDKIVVKALPDYPKTYAKNPEDNSGLVKGVMRGSW